MTLASCLALGEVVLLAPRQVQEVVYRVPPAEQLLLQTLDVAPVGSAGLKIELLLTRTAERPLEWVGQLVEHAPLTPQLGSGKGWHIATAAPAGAVAQLGSARDALPLRRRDILHAPHEGREAAATCPAGVAHT